MSHPWRSRRYLDAARDQPCVSCRKNDGTIVACHLTVPGMSGVSQKMPDFAVADCCSACHWNFDSGPWKHDYEHKMRCMIRTIQRRLEQGVLNAE